MFRILAWIMHRFSSHIASQLGAGYTSGDLLNRWGLSTHTGRDDHRIPGLLLDYITAVLHDRHRRNRTSCWDRLWNDGSWISRVNHTALGHVHGWVCGAGSPRVPRPFAVPWELDHGLTPSVWTTTPLNSNGRKVCHNNEEDRDYNHQQST